MGLPTDTRAVYWRKNLRLTGTLLGVWFFVTFVVVFFARELDFAFFGWPFSFWVAAQGALLVYLALIGAYAWFMNRLDDAAESEGRG
ncbi:MAG TPA: sodium/substrate symporter small subunit [Rhizobacter sp.]|nr:sodium/substrate symporter small subunit [Rhizobacter sp.]